MPNVSFTRGESTGIDSTPLKNGQILFDKGANRILLDVVIDNVLTRLTIKDGIFDGTTQEWDALTDNQKSVFKYVNLLDDYSGGGGGDGSPDEYYALSDDNYSDLIATNDDLNDFTSSGTYICTTAEIAATVTHSPTAQAFKMMVDISDVVSQTVYSETDMPWRRVLSGGTWGEWKQYVYKKELVTDAGIAIPANSDLDTYKTPGSYNIASDSIAATLLNLPKALCGKVLVLDNGNGGFTQFYFTNHNPKVYLRNYWKSWTEWVSLAQGGAEPTADDFYALSGGNYSALIEEDDDLDDYTSSGTYVCETATIATSLSNCPVETTFKLMVDVEGTSDITSQVIALVDDVDETLWHRVKTSNGDWGEWKHISAGAHTYEVGTQIPTNSDLNDYKTVGSYYVKMDSDASTIANTPENHAGKVIVLATTDSNSYYTQFYIINATNKIYSRYYLPSNQTWSTWVRIATMDDIADATVVKTYVGTCTTSADEKDKAATVDADFLLKKGVRVAIKFTNSNTASNCTLNVNSTGAKSIYYNGAVYTGTSPNICGSANRYHYFLYDGTYWLWDGTGVELDSNYTPQSLGLGYGTCATAEATTAKVVTLSGYNLVTNGYVSVKFTYAVPASATMNINSKGAKPIYYKGSAITANIIKAGDLATFIYNGSQYHLVGIDKAVEGGSVSGTVNYVGTCTTNADQQIKVATVDEEFELIKGVRVTILFSNNNTYLATVANPCKLNVNNTGAKNIYYNISATPTGTSAIAFGTANMYNSYIFDGTNWVWDGHSKDIDTIYTPQALGFGYGTCTTGQDTAEKAVTLSGYSLITNGYVSVKFTNAVPANATLNINSKGAKAIYYRGSVITAGVINAGDLATFIYNGSQYHLVGIDNLASINGVKLVGNKTSNDLGLMNKPTYLTQTLAAGSTTVTFTNAAISSSSLLSVYTSVAGLNYNSISTSSNTVTIEYDAQSSSITVTLEVKNV